MPLAVALDASSQDCTNVLMSTPLSSLSSMKIVLAELIVPLLKANLPPPGSASDVDVLKVNAKPALEPAAPVDPVLPVAPVLPVTSPKASANAPELAV